MPNVVGPFERAAQAAFYVTAAGVLAGAWIAVSARNLFRAALGLALALFGVAALYLFLEAEFLAVVQLLVYVGAILTLIIFGVMLTARIADPSLRRWNQQAGAAGVVALLVGAALVRALGQVPWPARGNIAAPPVTLAELGRVIVTDYVLPFELLSLLLLGALVGAIYIARRDSS